MTESHRLRKRTIGYSAAVGGVVATLADVVAKGEASAIGKIEKGIETHLLEGINIPQYSVLFLLVGIAIAICFIYDPQTKIKAFFVGASILSLIMTFVPYRLAPSLLTNPPHETVLKSPTKDILSYNFFRPASCFAQLPDESRGLPGETRQPGDATRELVTVNIQLVTDEERPISEPTVILQDSLSKKIIASSKFTISDFYFYQPAGDYIITVEAPGYRIVELEMSLQADQEKESLVIPLNATWIPLPLQRLLR